jgi:hypothetical protein
VRVSYSNQTYSVTYSHVRKNLHYRSSVGLIYSASDNLDTYAYHLFLGVEVLSSMYLGILGIELSVLCSVYNPFNAFLISSAVIRSPIVIA